MATALDLAFGLATRPGFDCLHDPDTGTVMIEPYHDPVGYPTIGYGRLLSRVPWEPLNKYPPITPERAREMAMEDLGRALAAVRRLCPVPLTVHQQAALADFAFNCGAGNLQASTLRQCVLRSDHEEAARQFGRWVFARGVKLPGLVRRRKAEAEMYLAE